VLSVTSVANIGFIYVPNDSQEIVHELTKHIIGQDEAKRAVAIARRNRGAAAGRRSLPPGNHTKTFDDRPPPVSEERNCAPAWPKLADAPFIKSRHPSSPKSAMSGRDVDTIIRDLVETAVKDTREYEKHAKWPAI